MKVLYVATSYPRDEADWRGVFIQHLAHALARSGHISLAIWAPPGIIPAGTRYAALQDEQQWLERLMLAGGIAHRMRSGGLAAVLLPVQLLRYLRRLYLRETDTDLYHLNWLQTALPLPGDGKPALVSVLGTDLKLLKLPLVKPLLRRAMRTRRVAICPNAEWMAEPLTRAFGDLAQITPVPFGIDPVWYAIDRQAGKEAPIWLAVTRLTRDKLGPLFAWSAPLFRGQKRQLHLLGPMQEQIDVPDWVHYHGSATPEELARDWFPRAHGLVTLSEHAEGRPQVMLEAMASSLPIIASDMPAHATIVQDGVTGHLCSGPDSYGDALARLEETAANTMAGNASRAWAKGEIGTWDDCAQRYLNIYRQLLDTGDA